MAFFSKTVDVSAQAAYPTVAQLDLSIAGAGEAGAVAGSRAKFDVGKYVFVNDHATIPIDVSFDGVNDHIRVYPGGTNGIPRIVETRGTVAPPGQIWVKAAAGVAVVLRVMAQSR